MMIPAWLAATGWARVVVPGSSEALRSTSVPSYGFIVDNRMIGAAGCGGHQTT